MLAGLVLFDPRRALLVYVIVCWYLIAIIAALPAGILAGCGWAAEKLLRLEAKITA
jgi:hypothetical protein